MIIKIISNRAYHILVGYEPYAPATRPHRRWLHSQCVAYKSEETETSEGSLHSWDLVGYVELMSNEYCRPKLADLVVYVELMSNR